MHKKYCGNKRAQGGGLEGGTPPLGIWSEDVRLGFGAKKRKTSLGKTSGLSSGQTLFGNALRLTKQL
jgi:hypothetical protein